MATGEGLYKVTFRSGQTAGSGVAVFRGGRVEGGDSLMFYRGTYTLDGEKLSVALEVGTHTSVAGQRSVLGVESAALSLEGRLGDPPVVLTGNSPQAPGAAFEAVLVPIT